jgi:hypothetical protein
LKSSPRCSIRMHTTQAQSRRRLFSFMYFLSNSNCPPGTTFPQAIPRHVHWLHETYTRIVSVKTAEEKALMRMAGNSERRPADDDIVFCFGRR